MRLLGRRRGDEGIGGCCKMGMMEFGVVGKVYGWDG